MKKCIPALLIILLSVYGVCFAETSENPPKLQSTREQLSTATPLEEPGVRQEYLAEQKVKMLPSRHGDTVDSYLTNMTRIPAAADLGWQVKAIEDGYEVERLILIKDSKTLHYKWKVTHTGETSPVNDRAKALMK